jgi:transposase
MPKMRITKKELEDHIIRGLTQDEIARKYQVGRSCVSHWTKRFGLYSKPRLREIVEVKHCDHYTEGLE